MSELQLATDSPTKERALSSDALEQVDQTVSDVFTRMFGLPVEIIDETSQIEQNGLDERTAIVGFSGSMRGSCEIHMSRLAVQALASAMMGGTLEEQPDDMLDDTIGEVCNMVGGGWKDRMPTAGSACTLSPPTVISGSNYRVRTTKLSAKLSRTYKFDQYSFGLVLQEDLC